MTPEERAGRIDRYRSVVADLGRTLESIPREAWRYKPGPDRWSIQEVVCHLADNETNGYLRIRRAVAEPGGSVMETDEEVWARELDYQSAEIDDMLELLTLVCRLSHRLISRIDEAVWSHTIDHPRLGLRTLEQWIEIYTRHVADHTRQIERTYDAWKRSRAGEPVDPDEPLFVNSGIL